MLGNQSLVARTLNCLLPVEFTEPSIVIFPKGYEEAFREALSEVPVAIQYIEGGLERRDSVKRGLDGLNPDTDIVVIHDAARPFPPLRAVCTAIDATRQYGAATLATPVTDTILTDNGTGCLGMTPDRSLLWSCQTPQVFQVDLIRQAYGDERNTGISCTDDATLVQRIGSPVKLVDGGVMNFKVTTKLELAFANYLLEQGLV